MRIQRLQRRVGMRDPNRVGYAWFKPRTHLTHSAPLTQPKVIMK